MLASALHCKYFLTFVRQRFFFGRGGGGGGGGKCHSQYIVSGSDVKSKVSDFQLTDIHETKLN